MIPYYTISKRVGYSGGIKDGQYYPPNIAIEWVEQVGHTNFNPFRDILAGGTLIGFGGKNYWVSDRKFIIGWVLKKLLS